jgi:cytochrome c oxidase subunit 2
MNTRRDLLRTCLLLAGCAHRRPQPRIIEIVARRWRFEPSTITLARGVPVILELTSADHHHGFNIPALGLRADVEPGTPARLELVPERAGTFPFHCDVFCGDGHEEMTGEIVVVP